MRNEPRNNDSWKESKPDNNDVSNVEVIVVLIRFCYYLSYDSENFLKIHIPCCIVREIKKTVFFSTIDGLLYYEMDKTYVKYVFFMSLF